MILTQYWNSMPCNIRFSKLFWCPLLTNPTIWKDFQIELALIKFCRATQNSMVYQKKFMWHSSWAYREGSLWIPHIFCKWKFIFLVFCVHQIGVKTVDFCRHSSFFACWSFCAMKMVCNQITYYCGCISWNHGNSKWN